MNKGKQFEQKFKEDWVKAFPDGFIYRLSDQMSGYKTTSKNPCDFICFVSPKLFLLECKSHAGNTLPFDKLTQLELLAKYSGLNNVIAGFVIWMYDKDKVFFIPVDEIIRMKKNGFKSFNATKIPEGYYVKELQGVKKRVYLDTDYKIMMEVADEIFFRSKS